MQAGLDALIAAPPDAHRARVREWLLTTVVDDAVLVGGALDHYVDIFSGPVGQASFSQHQVAHHESRHTDEVADRSGQLGRVSGHLIWGEQVTEWRPHRHWRWRGRLPEPPSTMTTSSCPSTTERPA